jgi:HNH endonuclease
MRFWDKVDTSGGPDACWAWTACKVRRGYGQVGVGKGKRMRAHRLSYALAFGDPGTAFVCHRCDNPACVNPAHLFLGTLEVNVADMVRKGRQATGERIAQSKLCAAKVSEIRRRHATGCRLRHLAREYGVSSTTIADAVARKTWRHV